MDKTKEQYEASPSLSVVVNSKRPNFYEKKKNKQTFSIVTEFFFQQHQLNELQHSHNSMRLMVHLKRNWF